MTQFLPPNLLALFAPRDPIPYMPPVDTLPCDKKNVHNYHGVAAFVADNFEDPADTPPPTRVETRDERLERKKREKEEQVAYKLEQEIAMWDPNSISDATHDPFKTLFVGRINYYTSESKLRREFESYGPIKQIKLVKDQDDKPRGYCFIEFEHEKDMHSAYKHADGKKIDGRRVLVDVERARTIKGWLARRLGGGLGGTRRGGPDVNVRHSGREDHGRDREDRRRRSRSRDRDRDRRRRRSRSRDRKRSRRSRSSSRDRKRSRSRDRKKSRRSRSRDRPNRRDRGRDRSRNNSGEDDNTDWNRMRIKDEPVDEEGGNCNNYRDFDGYADAQVKYEEDEVDRKPVIAHADNGANGHDY